MTKPSLGRARRSNSPAPTATTPDRRCASSSRDGPHLPGRAPGCRGVGPRGRSRPTRQPATRSGWRGRVRISRGLPSPRVAWSTPRNACSPPRKHSNGPAISPARDGRPVCLRMSASTTADSPRPTSSLVRRSSTREQGDRWTQGMMNVALGTSALWSGRIDALGHAESAIANFPEGADSVGVVQALAREVERSCGASPRSGLSVARERRGGPPVRPPNDMLRVDRRRIGHGRGCGAGPAVPRRVRRDRHRHRWRVGAPCRARAGAPARRRRRCRLRTTRCASGRRRRHLVSLGMGGHGACVPPRGVRSRRMPAAVETSGRSTYSDRVLARLAGACAAARAGDDAGAAVALDRARAAVPAGGDRVFPTIVAVARRSWPRNSPSPSCRSVEQKPSRHSHGSVSLTQAGGRRCERRQASSRPVLSTLPARGRYRPRRHR